MDEERHRVGQRVERTLEGEVHPRNGHFLHIAAIFEQVAVVGKSLGIQSCSEGYLTQFCAISECSRTNGLHRVGESDSLQVLAAVEAIRRDGRDNRFLVKHDGTQRIATAKRIITQRSDAFRQGQRTQGVIVVKCILADDEVGHSRPDEINSLQGSTGSESIGAQGVELGVQRYTLQLVTAAEGRTAIALRTAYAGDVLAEDDADDAVAVAETAANVLHLMGVALAVGHLVGNDDASGLVFVSSIAVNASERGDRCGVLVVVGEPVAVGIGHRHIAIQRFLIQIDGTQRVVGSNLELHSAVGCHLEVCTAVNAVPMVCFQALQGSDRLVGIYI